MTEWGMPSAIFHPDFKPHPFWWEDHEPQPLPEIALPKEARVAIVGAGYAGLSAALELNAQGLDCIVLDAHEPGFGQGLTRLMSWRDARAALPGISFMLRR